MKKSLINQVFGRLTVIEEIASKGKHRQFICLCSCGKKKKVSYSALKGSLTKSCGCLRVELNTTHNKSKSKLYLVWKSLKNRCASSDCGYGGKGITVCKEWLNDFVAFELWAISNGYSPLLTIDRKDNNLGYCPDNCRWATKTTQTRNRGKFKNTTSQFIGVSKLKNKWEANITVNKQRIKLGLFAVEKDAALARDIYIKENKLEHFTLNWS